MGDGNGGGQREEGGEMKRKRRGGGKRMEQREKNGALGERDGKEKDGLKKGKRMEQIMTDGAK